MLCFAAVNVLTRGSIYQLITFCEPCDHVHHSAGWHYSGNTAWLCSEVLSTVTTIIGVRGFQQFCSIGSVHRCFHITISLSSKESRWIAHSAPLSVLLRWITCSHYRWDTRSEAEWSLCERSHPSCTERSCLAKTLLLLKIHWLLINGPPNHYCRLTR